MGSAYGWKGYNGKTWTACIARKGYNKDLEQKYIEAKQKGECQGFVFVNVECKAISSTLIRKHLLTLREKACDKDEGGWKLKKKYNKKKSDKIKDNFRKNVKNMLHPEAVEYLIEHIDTLWIVNKGKVVGGGKPFNVVTNSNRKKKMNKKKKWWSFK